MTFNSESNSFTVVTRLSLTIAIVTLYYHDSHLVSMLFCVLSPVRRGLFRRYGALRASSRGEGFDGRSDEGVAPYAHYFGVLAGSAYGGASSPAAVPLEGEGFGGAI